MKIKYTHEHKTEYRFLKLVENGHVFIFLQFKDIYLSSNFWTGKDKYIGKWRFVPNQDYYLVKYITKNECPYSVKGSIEEWAKKFVNSKKEQELDAFIVENPYLDEHIDRLNIQRALYMDKREMELLRSRTF